MKYVEAILSPSIRPTGKNGEEGFSVNGRSQSGECSLDPVGSHETINAQLIRNGLISGDLVAIVRLSDLQCLIRLAETVNAHA